MLGTARLDHPAGGVLCGHSHIHCIHDTRIHTYVSWMQSFTHTCVRCVQSQAAILCISAISAVTGGSWDRKKCWDGVPRSCVHIVPTQ